VTSGFASRFVQAPEKQSFLETLSPRSEPPFTSPRKHPARWLERAGAARNDPPNKKLRTRPEKNHGQENGR
jgi:hypothetical protein